MCDLFTLSSVHDLSHFLILFPSNCCPKIRQTVLVKPGSALKMLNGGEKVVIITPKNDYLYYSTVVKKEKKTCVTYPYGNIIHIAQMFLNWPHLKLPIL